MEQGAEAAIRLGELFWDSWSYYRSEILSGKTPIPWNILIITLEIVVSISLMGYWFCTLYTRGHNLAKKKQGDDQPILRENEEAMLSSFEVLYNVGKEYLQAKMGVDENDTKNKMFALSELLKSDYAKLMQKYEEKTCRRLIMKRLRCCFVKHPYDYIGRRMAIGAKNVFLREVLEEHHWWHKLGGMLMIPDCIQSISGVKSLLIRAPIIIACFEIAYKGSVFSIDVYSDVNVLTDLNDDYDSFKMPKLGDLPNSTLAFQDFFLKKLPGKGMTGLRYPCEILDLLEGIVNGRTPLYKTLFSDIANIHFSPNRKSSHHISKVFNLLEDVAKVYEDFRDLFDSAGFGSSPSDIPNLVTKISNKMKSSQLKLEGFFVSFFGGGDVKKLRSILSQASIILDSANERILKEEIVRDILQEGDRIYKERLFNNFTVTQMAKEFGKQVKTSLNPATLLNFEYRPENDFVRSQLNDSQLECRKYIVKLFELFENDMIRESVLQYFLDRKSASNVDQVNKGTNSKLIFMTKHVMRSAWLFLLFTLIYTSLIELLRVVLEIIQFGSWPFVTNFCLKRDEKCPDSILFHGGNVKNKYVRDAANRFNININEATRETLYAVNIQIALYFYMSSFLFNYRESISGLMTDELPDEVFGLKESSFTQFRNSAMMNSLIAGVISLTFAQYKQYMVRHSGDVELLGKIVYIFACFFNSAAIFITQIAYYGLGLPFLLSILLTVIRYIVGFDAYEDLPDSDPKMIFFLIIIFVLLPLKFIPIMIGRVLKFLTEEVILCKSLHIAKRNRSGYDILGFDTALFMFLPCASNTYAQLYPTSNSLAPGFSYFSKDQISRKLYRLKFEVQIFSKCMMHLFYVITSVVLINTVHFFLRVCTVQTNAYYLSSLEVPEIKNITDAVAFILPLTLLLSFLCLHTYYKRLHPWLSEGVSMGFQPRDREIWHPLGEITSGDSEPEWGVGDWHDGEVA